MNLYFVYDGEMSEGIDLVLHHTARQAKVLAWKKGDVGWNAEEFIGLSVRLVKDMPRAQAQANERHDEPCVVDDPAIQRLAGMWGEKMLECSSCGLQEFHGVEVSKVCDGCHQCIECSCICHLLDDWPSVSSGNA